MLAKIFETKWDFRMRENRISSKKHKLIIDPEQSSFQRVFLNA